MALRKREQEIAFQLAKQVSEMYLADKDDRKPWLFPQTLAITKLRKGHCRPYATPIRWEP
ncbi:hypothetical protein [Nonomuraea sp. NPDC049129]|uniref:hypothetical protein n=1 Tax=Nonomuraea sp. NPDC049129 TaxID=3155272 RepID=UPI0033EF3403